MERCGTGKPRFVWYAVRLPDGFVAYRSTRKSDAEERLPRIQAKYPGAEMVEIERK